MFFSLFSHLNDGSFGLQLRRHEAPTLPKFFVDFLIPHCHVTCWSRCCFFRSVRGTKSKPLCSRHVFVVGPTWPKLSKSISSFAVVQCSLNPQTVIRYRAAHSETWASETLYESLLLHVFSLWLPVHRFTFSGLKLLWVLLLTLQLEHSSRATPSCANGATQTLVIEELQAVKTRYWSKV